MKPANDAEELRAALRLINANRMSVSDWATAVDAGSRHWRTAEDSIAAETMLGQLTRAADRLRRLLQKERDAKP